MRMSALNSRDDVPQSVWDTDFFEAVQEAKEELK